MCENRYLALSGPFRIEGCTCCGKLSIHLGPVTVRVDQKALESLHNLAGAALQRLASGQGETTMPVGPGSHVN